LRPSRWSTTKIELHVYKRPDPDHRGVRKPGSRHRLQPDRPAGSRRCLLGGIGKAHGRTEAQVCLRYLVQQDIIVIPKTSRVSAEGECRDLTSRDGAEMKRSRRWPARTATS